MSTKDTPKDCAAHNGTAPATTCTPCAASGHICTHPTDTATYCTPCASVHYLVWSCVDSDTLTHSDYEVWATDSTEGAPPEDLRPIAGWWAGWTLQDGSPWPISDRDALTAA